MGKKLYPLQKASGKKMYHPGRIYTPVRGIYSSLFPDKHRGKKCTLKSKNFFVHIFKFNIKFLQFIFYNKILILGAKTTLREEMVPSGVLSSPIFMLTNRGKICHHHYGIWEETLGEEMVPSKVHFPPHFLW